jgi:hypothetical protein
MGYLGLPGPYHTGMPSLPVAVLRDPAALVGIMNQHGACLLLVSQRSARFASNGGPRKNRSW